MKPGDVSQPFETVFGFHIVKLIKGPKSIKRPFSAVEGDIRYQLRNKAKQAELKRLRSKMSVKWIKFQKEKKIKKINKLVF